jgi:hypothetical protein
MTDDRGQRAEIQDAGCRMQTRFRIADLGKHGAWGLEHGVRRQENKAASSGQQAVCYPLLVICYLLLGRTAAMSRRDGFYDFDDFYDFYDLYGFNE